MSTTPLDSRAASGTGGSRRWALGLKILVSLVLLLLVARSVDVAAVGALLLELPLWAALAAVTALAAISLVSGLRWWLVMRAMKTPLPLGQVTALMFIGTFFTQVLPTSVGGDAVRIWQVSRQGIGFQRAFIGVMLERVSGLVALVLMVVAGVLWLGSQIDQPGLRLLLLTSLPVLAAGLVMLCLLDRLPETFAARVARLPLLGTSLGLLQVMAGDARRVLLSQPLSLQLLLLSAAAQLCSVLALLALAQGLGLALGFAEALAVVPAIILITFIPLSFAGWGIREGASVVMLGCVGLAADQAVAVSVLFGLASLLAGLPGCLLWLKGGRRLPPAAA